MEDRQLLPALRGNGIPVFPARFCFIPGERELWWMPRSADCRGMELGFMDFIFTRAATAEERALSIPEDIMIPEAADTPCMPGICRRCWIAVGKHGSLYGRNGSLRRRSLAGPWWSIARRMISIRNPRETPGKSLPAA